jgi:tRNA dimethylallyltransferase
MSIGTAAPMPDQLSRAKHYFIGILSPEEYYSASRYEEEAITLIQGLHKKHSVVIMTGGSMLYIDAVCRGIDEIPTIDEELRNNIQELYRKEGLDPIRQQLKLLDPVFYRQVDLKNPKRVIHALEVCLMTGKPYSSLRTHPRKKRPFRIVKIGLTRERHQLYDLINARVDEMISEGLIEEAQRLYPFRHLNALNTVGYKELFDYFDGKYDLNTAIDKIKQHSRNYARKQLSWFKRDKEIHWINLSDKKIDVEAEIMKQLSLL